MRSVIDGTSATIRLGGASAVTEQAADGEEVHPERHAGVSLGTAIGCPAQCRHSDPFPRRVVVRERGRSPGSRLHTHLPGRRAQWLRVRLVALKGESLTVAGPRRVCTGFRLASFLQLLRRIPAASGEGNGGCWSKLVEIGLGHIVVRCALCVGRWALGIVRWTVDGGRKPGDRTDRRAIINHQSADNRPPTAPTKDSPCAH
jgi:hypothetical protein